MTFVKHINELLYLMLIKLLHLMLIEKN